MKMITRTVSRHIVHIGEIIMSEGVPTANEIGTIELVNATYTDEKALRKARGKFGRSKSLVVMKVDTTETTYAMEMEKFMEQAEVICGTGVTK